MGILQQSYRFVFINVHFSSLNIKVKVVQLSLHLSPKVNSLQKHNHCRGFPDHFQNHFSPALQAMDFFYYCLESFLGGHSKFWAVGRSRVKGWVLKGHSFIYWGIGKTSINFWLLMLIVLIYFNSFNSINCSLAMYFFTLDNMIHNFIFTFRNSLIR